MKGLSGAPAKALESMKMAGPLRARYSRLDL